MFGDALGATDDLTDCCTDIGCRATGGGKSGRASVWRVDLNAHQPSGLNSLIKRVGHELDWRYSSSSCG